MAANERPSIAVVDDEPKLLVALQRLLGSHGFEVKSYESSVAFLAAAASESPDCLVLDLHMPTCSGFEVLESLRRLGIGIPTILITGRDEPSTQERAAQLGAAAFLLKPLDEPDLLSAIARVCPRSVTTNTLET